MCDEFETVFGSWSQRVRSLIIKPMVGSFAVLIVANLSVAGCDNSYHDINTGDHTNGLMRLYSDDYAGSTRLNLAGINDRAGCARTTDCGPDSISGRDSASEHLTSSFVWHLR